MLIRFVVKNLYSFSKETEFNLLPNKTQRLSHHKIRSNDIDFLRFSAIYGANGSGKSNLIKSVALLESMVEDGKLKTQLDELKFKLKTSYQNEPTSLGIEFLAKNKLYYYSLTFHKNEILNEYLAESSKDKDELIFERNFENKVQSVEFFESYYEDPKNKLFADVLAEKLIQKNELIITFLAKKYQEDFPSIKDVFDWFDTTLVIIRPDAKPGAIAHVLDLMPKKKDFAKDFICSLNTGISNLEIETNVFEEFVGKDELASFKRIVDDFKDDPDMIRTLTNSETGEEISLVHENGELLTKRLVTSHLNHKGEGVDFNLGEESDGTKRLIEYMLAFESIINESKVYLIDEIERSIHPIMIKEIISKISHDQEANGQLIFTTHESNLLDQDILRPDEIWFVQKDVDGSSKLYSLSDFKIHNTIDIQNGYLSGRYGGIPFLSKLKDINWHKYEISE